MFSKLFLVFQVSSILCVQQTMDKPEGTGCTWGAYNGTCLDVHKCFSFVVDKVNKEYPPICSYQDKVPIICCTECPEEHRADISNAVFHENTGILWRTGRKSWDTCIDYLHRLPYLPKFHLTFELLKKWNDTRKCHSVFETARAPVGGEDTRRGEYPFMALLGYGSDVESAKWLCGGTLISNRFILTAGHCISSAQFGPVKYIALGVWKRSEPNELWQRHIVKRIVPHPEYKSPAKYHDIALLETEKPIEFTLGTLPACLHSGVKREFKLRGDDIFALGWGSLGPGKHLADIMQKVFLQYYTDEECASMYPPDRLLKDGYNSTTQMCYGDRETPRDTCQGDSGGPLVMPGEVSPSVMTVIGVTSYGVQCGRGAGAGVYTRVTHYLPWIESLVWP